MQESDWHIHSNCFGLHTCLGVEVTVVSEPFRGILSLSNMAACKCGMYSDDGLSADLCKGSNISSCDIPVVSQTVSLQHIWYMGSLICVADQAWPSICTKGTKGTTLTKVASAGPGFRPRELQQACIACCIGVWPWMCSSSTAAVARQG